MIRGFNIGSSCTGDPSLLKEFWCLSSGPVPVFWFREWGETGSSRSWRSKFSPLHLFWLHDLQFQREWTVLGWSCHYNTLLLGGYRESRELLLHLLLSAQSNPYDKVAYLGVASPTDTVPWSLDHRKGQH